MYKLTITVTDYLAGKVEIYFPRKRYKTRAGAERAAAARRYTVIPDGLSTAVFTCDVEVVEVPHA